MTSVPALRTRRSRSNTERFRCAKRCEALRADHWLHNHPEAPATLRAAIRQQMRDAFYIDTDEWKAQVYAQARAAALTALERLAP